MKVFKFGGASIKDAQGLKKIAEILASSQKEVIVVVSAMGKTTNALEKLIPKIDEDETEKRIREIEEYHFVLAKEVKEPYRDLVYQSLQKDFADLRIFVNEYP